MDMLHAHSCHLYASSFFRTEPQLLRRWMEAESPRPYPHVNDEATALYKEEEVSPPVMPVIKSFVANPSMATPSGRTH
jgi:hypothetical protein